MPERPRPRIAYVLKGYPRLSEVFIASEVYRLEQLDVPLRLFVLKAADEDVQHDVVARIVARPEYLPRTSSLSATTARAWLRRNGGRFSPALARTVRRHPLGVLRSAGMALAQSVRARKRRFGGLRKVYLKEWLLAVELADRVETGEQAGHLHAHFAHGTTTVTWLASAITGIPFSFTGHAKDIYTEELNPAGLLRRKLDAARFVVTCTRANLDHLAALGSGTPVHVVYHGLNADFAGLVAGGVERVAPQRVRLLSVGRLVRKKGLDTFVDACALLRDRGLDFEAVIAGESGDHEDVVRARIAEHGLTDRVSLRGPLTQHGLFEQYRRATAFALPCRVLEDGDRDGIPNVLMEAMACGLPVVSTGVSGITELVHDGIDGLVVPTDDPAELANALHRIVKDPALAASLGTAARATVLTHFDAGVTARTMAGLLTGRPADPAAP